MRVISLLVLLSLLSGCADEPTAKTEAGPRVVGASRGTLGPTSGPLTLGDYEYTAPNATGAWAAAFWLRSETIRACDFHLRGTARPGGGTWDSFAIVAKGWQRPELVGRFDHGFSRGDGYVAHAGSTGTNHSVKQSAAPGPDTLTFEQRRRVDLPTEALILIGNTYMAPPKAGVVGLQLRLSCDGDFVLLQTQESARVLAYGPEDFDGLAITDTTLGIGVQRGASKSLQAQSGFILLLHEDGNQGNAEYTTVRPDGSTQTDAFGNRVVVGGPGAWRVGLNRVSPSLQGEFRLFALDLPVPDPKDLG